MRLLRALLRSTGVAAMVVFLAAAMLWNGVQLVAMRVRDFLA